MSTLEVITAVIAAAGGSALIVAALAAWLGKVWADRIAQSQKLMQGIDLDLREKRVAVYPELWKATEILPKWPRKPDVTYDDLDGLSKTLRDWYFRTGGMYLSRSTHKNAYSPLQDALAEVLKHKPSGKIPAERYDELYEKIRARCSALRTALADDIESRREGFE